MRLQKKAQEGIALLESLFVVFICGLFAFGTIASVLSAFKAREEQKKIVTRERLVDSLVNFASLPASYRAAVSLPTGADPLNQTLRDCLGAGSTCYTRHSDGQFRGMRLFLPIIKNTDTSNGGTFGFVTSGPITGTPQFPIRFNANGEVCDTLSSRCVGRDFPFEAVTEFLPFCDSNLILSWQGMHDQVWNGPLYPAALATFPSCSVARSLKVRLSVQSSGTSGPNAEPHGASFARYTRVVYVSGYEVVWPHQ